MGNPQNNHRKHENDTLRNIGVAVIGELCWVVLQDVFQNQDSLREMSQSPERKFFMQTYHAARKASCHQCESDKKE